MEAAGCGPQLRQLTHHAACLGPLLRCRGSDFEHVKQGEVVFSPLVSMGASPYSHQLK